MQSTPSRLGLLVSCLAISTTLWAQAQQLARKPLNTMC